MRRRMLIATAVIAIFLLPLIIGCHGSGGATLGGGNAGNIVGAWWYAGGVDADGNPYTLADLPFLQYFRIEFVADGTFVAYIKYCEHAEQTQPGTWEFNPATNTVTLDGLGFEDGQMVLTDDELHATDWTGDWTLHFVTDETTNPCTRATNPADDILGDWWYSGGIDDEGSGYDLADLPYLEYIRLSFAADGTYTTQYRYCGGAVTNGGGTWEMDPATGEFEMTGDIVGNHAVYLAENRLESRDVDTGWTYFYADSETTNTCDRGANPQAEIVGDWWYEGGVDDEGSAYDLADLPYLEYVRLDFNADGTYDTEYKYCRGLVNTGGGTWTFNPATGQFDATGDVIGNHVIWHRNGRVETADTQTGWQYFYAASETRNDCGD